MSKQKRRPRGKVERLRAGPESPGLDRDLTVYLPPSYGRGERRYPVLYMQDGQNLFDPKESFAGSWRVDIAMDHAAARTQKAASEWGELIERARIDGCRYRRRRLFQLLIDGRQATVQFGERFVVGDG